MSQQIDNQIVKMQFDNASFEKNVHQSMSTIEKLKAALKFDKVNMSPLQQAFSETEATATKAGFHIRDIWLKVGNIIEQEVAQKVVDAGKKMLNALTFEGINDGFKEYELKMGSIQTIMAGTGESLATVNHYLDELNTYSDKTIYSFSDMTNSIGKFTNAGVNLKDAVNAIKGIANEAAVSGANANEASRAMYNFAQALSAGYVKLIDWKSIENANMATKEFKDTLLEVGVGMGTVTKSADGMYKILTSNNQGRTMDDLVSGTKNFNDSLQYQWMTTEVLTSALEIYATDIRELTQYERNLYEEKLRGLGFSEEQIQQFEKLGMKAADAATEIKTFSMLIDTLKEAIGSGWAMTWQYFIGDFEQAKVLFTEVGNTLGGLIDHISDARNTFLKNALQTGWERFTTWKGLEIPESEKYREILVDLAKKQGVLNDEQYMGITSTDTLVKSFHKLGWVTGDLLKESVSDYLKILQSMSDEERNAMGISDDQLHNLETMNHLLEIGAVDADKAAKMMTELGGRENIIAGLKNVFEALVNVIRPIGEAFNDVFGVMDPTKLFDLTVRFREFTSQLKVSEAAMNTIKTSFTLIFSGIKLGLNAVITAISGVTKLILPLLNLFDAIFGVIGQIIASITGSKGVLGAAEKVNKLGDKISKVYLTTMQKIADLINKIANGIRNIPESPIFNRIGEGVNQTIASLKAFWQEFQNLPIVQQMVNDFWNAVSRLQNAFGEFANKVNQYFASIKQSADTYINLDTLNTVLTKIYTKFKDFLKILKDFAKSVKEFFKGLKEGKTVVESFRDSFGDIIDKIKELKENIENFFKSLFEKGDEMGDKFNLREIQQAIHEFATNITADQITMIAVAGSFMLIAINLLRLSEAMRGAVEAFTGVGLALKNVINSYMKKSKSTILQVAEAIVIVAAALWVLSTIPKDQLADAIGAIEVLTGCIVALTAAMVIADKVVGKEKDIVKLATGLVILSSSFLILTGALKALEFVNIDGVVPKLVVLGVVIGTLIAISSLMGKMDKFSKGSLTVVAVSASLLLAATALAEIGKMPLESIDKAISAMLKIMIGLAAVVLAAGQVGVFSGVGLIMVVLTLDKLLPSVEKLVNYDYDKIESGLKKNEEIIKKLGGIVVIMAALGVLAGNRLKGVGIGLLSISAAFAILTGIAKLAGMMKPSELQKGKEFLWELSLMISIMELCSTKTRVGMFGGKNGGEGSKAFTRIAVAMGILLGIGKLASMMKPEELVKAELALAGLSLIVGLLIRVAKDAGKAEGALKSIAAMIFGISTVLGMVAVLSLIDMKSMAPALTAVLGVILALAAVCAAMAANVHTIEKGGDVKVTGILQVMTVLIVIGGLAGVLVALSNMDSSKVWTAAKSMMAVIGAVAAVVVAMGLIKEDAINGAQLRTLVGAVITTAAVGGILYAVTAYMTRNKVDPSVMLQAAKAIATVLIGLSPALAAMSLFKGHTDYRGMAVAVLGAIAALAVVSGALLLLTNFGGSGDEMIKSALALGIGLVAVSLPIAVLGVVGKLCNSMDAAGMAAPIIGALGAVIMVSNALVQLSNVQNPENLIPAATALAIGMAAICLPIAVLGVVGHFVTAENIPGMATIVVSAIVSMYAVKDILIQFANSIDMPGIERLNAAIPSLSVAIAGVAVLAVAIAAAGRIAGSPAAVGAGFVAIIAAIVGLAAVVLALDGLGAALEHFDGLNGRIVAGLDMLVVIAEKLGEAIGAFIGGIGVGITNQLDPIADNLNNFSKKMITFSENLSQISAEALTGAKNLAAAMIALGAAEFVDSILNFLTIGKREFDFESLGKALAKFCDSIKDIPSDAVTKASACSVIAKRLSEVGQSLDLSGGWVQKIFGQRQSMDSFADGVASLGKGIAAFCEAVKDIPGNSVELAQRAADTTKPMIEMTKTLQAQGGLLQRIMGEKNLGQFGENLASFVAGLVAFVAALVTLEATSPNYGELIQRCADATQPMIELSYGLENMGGILADVVGDDTLDRFGEKLVPFAKGLHEFVKELKSMVEEVPNFAELIDQCTIATKKLITLQNSLKNMGGIGTIFTGDDTLSKFGDRLVDFGKSLKKYAKEIAEIDFSKMDEANASIEKLINVGVAASELQEGAFDVLINAMKSIAEMPIETIIQTLIDGFPRVLEQYTQMFNGLVAYVILRISMDKPTYILYGTELVLGIIAGIFVNKIKIIFELIRVVNAIRTYLSGELNVEKFVVYGRNLILGILKGIQDNKSKITHELIVINNNIRAYMDDAFASSAFESYGANVALGVARGIESQQGAAVAAAERLAEAVNAVLATVLRVASPSKVAYADGMYVAMGLANGISDYSANAVKSTEKMAEEVVDSASSIVTAIATAIDDNIDIQPTIRPVLDTTDIERKASDINNLFRQSDLELAYRASGAINQAYIDKATIAQTKDEESSKPIQQINYTQNNYSPKALSRVDIYRDTKNQLSMMKGVVKANA